MTTVTRADRRLAGRMAVALVATLGLGVPFLLLALLVRGQWGPLLDLDTTVAERLNEVAREHSWLVDLMQDVSFVGGPWVLRPIVTVLGVVLLVRHRRRLGAWVLVALWAGALLGVVLKLIVARARPQLAEAVAAEGGKSFPSGHALGAAIAFGLLALVLGTMVGRRARIWVWVAAVAGTLLVSLSRLVLGVHYLSDVTAGMILGAAWLVGTAAAFHTWRRDVGLPEAPAGELEPELGEGIPEPRSG